MIIDATNSLIGRICTHAAKAALQGEEVIIINCEKAVLSGSKSYLKSHYQRKQQMGVPRKGPFQPRMADRFLRKKVRGMLPYKTARGRDAMARVMCYIGNPHDKAGIQIPGSSADKLPLPKQMTVGEICAILK